MQIATKLAIHSFTTVYFCECKTALTIFFTFAILSDHSFEVFYQYDAFKRPIKNRPYLFQNQQRRRSSTPRFNLVIVKGILFSDFTSKIWVSWLLFYNLKTVIIQNQKSETLLNPPGSDNCFCTKVKGGLKHPPRATKRYAIESENQ